MKNVLVENNDKVTTIIINRPEVKNAIDEQTASELIDAFQRFDQDDTAHVAVLCGIDDCFCAGADLNALANQRGSIDLTTKETAPLGVSRMQLSKPVIAAISGFAVAGGLELALWCDLRIMEQNAIMGVFCRRWGVPLVDGGTVRLPRLIGLSRAMDLILTGRSVMADEALAIGLANRVVEDGCARQAAESLALTLAQFPQQCLRHDRLSTQEQFDFEFTTALANESKHGTDVLASGESVQGAQQFAAGKGRHGSFDY